MGLCYSLRPLLFGDSEDAPCPASETPVEDAQPGAARAPAAPTRLPAGSGQVVACARPREDRAGEGRRRPEQQRAEEREAAKEARKVSRGIDRMLREQKRDLQLTHRLLLLGDVADYEDMTEQLITLTDRKQGVNSEWSPVYTNNIKA